MKNKNFFLYMVIFLLLIFSFFLSYKNRSNLDNLSKQIQLNIKELESLKMDLELLKKEQKVISSLEISKENRQGVTFWKQKFNAVRSELESLKKYNSYSKIEQEEYNKREAKIWDELNNGVKQIWSGELSKKLTSFGIEQESIDLIVADYQQTLDKSKDLLLGWYRNEISDTEFWEMYIKISREFYDDMEKSVGPNLASIALSVIFPDVDARRFLFEATK